MSLNVENLVRSAVILVVGLPVTIGLTASAFRTETSAVDTAVSNAKAELVDVCMDYAISKPDSRLERDSKDAIDKVLGADGADYKSLCNWVL
jgi:hypothetical protein